MQRSTRTCLPCGWMLDQGVIVIQWNAAHIESWHQPIRSVEENSNLTL